MNRITIPDKYRSDIEAAVRVLRDGGIILYPTDTIWGIGCDATCPEAVERVYRLKKRADSKAMICLVDSQARLQRYVREVPDVAWQVMDVATRPTTMILDGAVNLAPNLIAADGTVALRITNEPFSQALCYRFQRALVSTSANISGEKSPRTFADIDRQIIDGADYVCLSRRRERNNARPSSIIKLTSGGIVDIIRP